MQTNAGWVRCRFVLGSSLCAVILVACGRGESDSKFHVEARAESADSSAAAGAASSELTCEDDSTVDTPVGRLTNNVWNKQAIGESPYTQCIRVRESAAGKEYGWSWSWPIDSHAVVAYPETVIGWKPWVGGTSTHSKLPIRIDELELLRWSYTLQTTADGKHNLATSLWLTRTGQTSAGPNPNDISTELMIWTDHTGFSPAGEHLGTARIDDTEFEVWFGKDWGDASGTASNRWNYIAYRSTDKLASATLDLKKILGDAVERELVSPQHYVANIEIGNEVMSGAGETWIKALSLEVR